MEREWTNGTGKLTLSSWYTPLTWGQSRFHGAVTWGTRSRVFVQRRVVGAGSAWVVGVRGVVIKTSDFLPDGLFRGDEWAGHDPAVFQGSPPDVTDIPLEVGAALPTSLVPDGWQKRHVSISIKELGRHGER